MPAKYALLPLWWALLPTLAAAQIAFKKGGPISTSQSALPSQGPAASRINPADLADVHLASFTYGFAGSTRVKYRNPSFQLAAGVPWDRVQMPAGLAAGLGYYGHISDIMGTSTIFEEKEFDPAIATSFPANPEARYRISVGLAWTFITYSAFDAVRTKASGMDAGLLATATGSYGRWGLGFAYHHLRSPRVRLPEDLPDYKVPGWMEPSAEWASATKLIRLRMGLYLDEPADPKEGPAPEDPIGMNGWDIEVRPLSWFALKAERTRLAVYSSLGAVLYPPRSLIPVDARFEINIGHSKYDPSLLPVPFRHFLFGSNPNDEGLGWLLGISLSVGI